MKYSLAVRLARENQYGEASRIYTTIGAGPRAARMRELASLYRAAYRPAAGPGAKFKLGEFISRHPDGIYFNDALWNRLQRYALVASKDNRLSGEERRRLMRGERKLKDDQEERWRAYLLLRDVAHRSGKTELGRKAALLAIHCLDGISERFERKEDIRKADGELIAWLQHG